ncbi:hypothetical protein KUCAC02_035726, partial [Chaenocephalus aceratus]
MLQVLACGAVVFPGLFFALRRLLPCVFKHWSDADVVLISERDFQEIVVVVRGKLRFSAGLTQQEIKDNKAETHSSPFSPPHAPHPVHLSSAQREGGGYCHTMNGLCTNLGLVIKYAAIEGSEAWGLVSSIHAVMATTAGVIVVSSCRGSVISDRHWLATYFVIWFGVPYMTYDIFAMYLSHYHRFRVKGHEDYKRHSLRTISTFVRREFLLVLHHIALLTILLPVTL